LTGVDKGWKHDCKPREGKKGASGQFLGVLNERMLTLWRCSVVPKPLEPKRPKKHWVQALGKKNLQERKILGRSNQFNKGVKKINRPADTNEQRQTYCTKKVKMPVTKDGGKLEGAELTTKFERTNHGPTGL